METGRPVETEVAKKLRAGEAGRACGRRPAARKNWPHAAFNPQTGLLYANTHARRADVQAPADRAVRQAGQRYMFIENLPLPRAPGEPIGHVDAIDPLTGKQKWRVPLTDMQNWSAMLATGGGLLFTGKRDRRVHRARRRHRQDAVAVPDQLRHQRPAGHLHAQRPAVRDGARRASAGCTGTSRKEQLKNVPQGGSVWTFAVMPD